MQKTVKAALQHPQMANLENLARWVPAKVKMVAMVAVANSGMAGRAAGVVVGFWEAVMEEEAAIVNRNGG